MDCEMAVFFVSIWLKFFFLLTPFFALTVFIAMTKDLTLAEKRATALKTTAAVTIICLFLYFFGNMLFRLFGITLDAFRIGAGAVLFLNAIGLINGTSTPASEGKGGGKGGISVVPMAIPFIVGPGTTGALLVMGAETTEISRHVAGSAALCVAIACVGGFLFLSTLIEKITGRDGLNVLSKVSGLILASLAAQIIFTGIRNFLETGQ